MYVGGMRPAYAQPENCRNYLDIHSRMSQSTRNKPGFCLRSEIAAQDFDHLIGEFTQCGCGVAAYSRLQLANIIEDADPSALINLSRSHASFFIQPFNINFIKGLMFVY